MLVLGCCRSNGFSFCGVVVLYPLCSWFVFLILLFKMPCFIHSFIHSIIQSMHLYIPLCRAHVVFTCNSATWYLLLLLLHTIRLYDCYNHTKESCKCFTWPLWSLWKLLLFLSHMIALASSSWQRIFILSEGKTRPRVETAALREYRYSCFREYVSQNEWHPGNCENKVYQRRGPPMSSAQDYRYTE